MASIIHARARADELDKKLLATDKRLNGAVHLVHLDGTSLFFDRAFALRMEQSKPVPGEAQGWWIIVVTEHHGSHVYDRGELKLVRTYATGAPIKRIK